MSFYQNPVVDVAGQENALGIAVTPSGKTVVAVLPMPKGLNETTARIRSGADEYLQLYRSRRVIRATLSLTLLLVTVFVFFSSVWLAVFLSKQITHPVEALADAMDAILPVSMSNGSRTSPRERWVTWCARSITWPRTWRRAVNWPRAQQAQLTAANMAVEERRRELETIVDTIPSGVVTLDGAGVVLQSNRAFAALMGSSRMLPWPGSASKRCFLPNAPKIWPE